MSNQNVERAKAINTIRKLRNQTTERGRTEAEATLAMTRMSELMEVYDITMDEVSLGNIEFVKEYIAIGSTKTGIMDRVLVGIGEFTGTVVWHGREPNTTAQYTRNYKRRTMKAHFFFGAREDVEMALHIYAVIQNVIKHETEAFKKTLKGRKFYRGEKRSLTHGFQMGLVSRINEQLEEQADKREERISETGNALMEIKDQKVNEELRKLGIHLCKSHRQNRNVNLKGWGAGRQAGEGINLNRPIQSGPKGPLLLQ